MARESVEDRQGNEIYLTDERWQHILETHEEMANCRGQLLETLRTGQRKQDAFDPQKHKYSQKFTDLPDDFTHVIAAVKFSRQIAARGDAPNNFVLTAYQTTRGQPWDRSV
jgi:hypothetical protein